MADPNVSFSRLLRSEAPVAPAAPPHAALVVTPEIELGAVTLASVADGQDLRLASHSLTRIHFIDKAGKVRTFQYSFLDAESRFEGGSFILLFAGIRHWQITVTGRGPMFWSIYDYITLHRWPALREATGSMPGAGTEGETVFTGIVFKDVTPE